VRLPAVPGITPVPLHSVEETSAALLTMLGRLRDLGDIRDPTLESAAVHAAELAHGHDAGLLAIVEHKDADPGILVAVIVAVARPLDTDGAAELGYFLADAGGPAIREVTQASTAAGYPVVIAERILVSGPGQTGPPEGAQLQAIVIDPSSPRIAVFTLHSPTGRGWLELAGIAGTLVSGVDFSGAGAGVTA